MNLIRVTYLNASRIMKTQTMYIYYITIGSHIRKLGKTEFNILDSFNIFFLTIWSYL
jgi:hypothetical protein